MTGLVLAMLLVLPLWSTPMAAQAMGNAAPVITSPTNGATVDVGLGQVEVDFTGAPVGVYTVTLGAIAGSLVDDTTYAFDGSNPQAVLELGPITQAGRYFVRVLQADGTVVQESQFSAIEPPGAPQDLTATAESQEATLSWQPPASDGGSPITGYQVQLESFASTRQDLAPTARSFRFTNLTNGTPYRLYVRTQNAAGSSPWASVLATPSLPVRRPSPPAFARASAGSHRATLRWTYTPGDNGGTALIRYQIQRGTTAVTRRNLPPFARSYLFTRLTNGRTYDLYVRAQNSVGFSRWVSASATPARPPFAPARVRATASSQRARLYWAYQRGGNGGAAITVYQVQRGSNIATRRTRSRTARSHPFIGLTNGATYRLYVRARNRVGYGPWARASATPRRATTFRSGFPGANR